VRFLALRIDGRFANSNSQLGYGTWQAAPGEVGNGVYEALKIGYRHLVSVPETLHTRFTIIVAEREQLSARL
jgi:hypothetical protein